MNSGSNSHHTYYFLKYLCVYELLTHESSLIKRCSKGIDMVKSPPLVPIVSTKKAASTIVFTPCR